MMTRLKVAILALYPDAGHIVPLLRIGAMLVTRGHEVICLLPRECTVLADSYGLTNKQIGTALSPVAAKASREFGARTILSASFDVYYRDYYSAIFAESVEMVEAILKELEARPPDLVLVDNHQFPDVFAGIGAELDVPVLFHDSAGGLHSRAGSLAVNVYGKPMARWRQLAVLAAGSVYYLCRQAARVYRFRRHGLSQATVEAREQLRRLLTRLPPSDESHAESGSAGAVSPASRRMKYHFATGLALLEHRHRGLALYPDREAFGPILDLPERPLPGDLKRWLDSQRENSVVYVSFGSMVNLSAPRLRVLLSAFAALDAPLLWALGGGKNALPNLPLPSTVRVEAFVPQWSVLSHAAVGVCVTHGGVGTVVECLAASVPMVVIPVMWDQPYNAEFVQELGAGIRLDWWDLNDRALVETLQSVRLSPEYRRRVSSIAMELRAQRGSEQVLCFLKKVADSGDTESWARAHRTS
jgi:UDP:flavonoid glycosyltransferase YjiC (YdhE family)